MEKKREVGRKKRGLCKNKIKKNKIVLLFFFSGSNELYEEKSCALLFLYKRKGIENRHEVSGS